MDHILRRIEENTAPKDSFQLMISSSTTDFTTRFNPPLQLKRGKQYELALLNLEKYYSLPNIDSSNNNFTYSPGGGATWFTITLPERSYEVTDAAIKLQMEDNNYYDDQGNKYYTTIGANFNTLKAVLTLENSYQVYFTSANSVRHVLGFNSAIYTAGYHESENVVNIMNISSILVNVDIVTGSYVNGTMQPVIYSFFPNV